MAALAACEGATTDATRAGPAASPEPSDAGGGDDRRSEGSDAGAEPSPGADAATAGDAAGAADARPDGAALVAARPYTFRVPAGYDPKTPTPLVVALHGYNDDGAIIDSYFGLGALVDAKGFLYATPDGTVDLIGRRFWNATDACCDLTFQPVDDVAYLNALLDDVQSKYNVDPKRIFFVGHSNGAFMTHRFACEAAPRVAAIVSLAGAVWFDPARCAASAPVSVLQVHGDDDQTIHYEGGFAAAPYPSAHQTVATWATKDGCTGALAPTGDSYDLDPTLAGAETRVERYGGCATTGVELWTMHGGPHIPSLVKPLWPELIYAFLVAHPKP